MRGYVSNNGPHVDGLELCRNLNEWYFWGAQVGLVAAGGLLSVAARFFSPKGAQFTLCFSTGMAAQNLVGDAAWLYMALIQQNRVKLWAVLGLRLWSLLFGLAAGSLLVYHTGPYYTTIPYYTIQVRYYTIL